MKKSLFISALVAFVMMFCVNVNAQEKATGKAYKDLKKQEKVLDKDLQKKAMIMCLLPLTRWTRSDLKE